MCDSQWQDYIGSFSGSNCAPPCVAAGSTCAQLAKARKPLCDDCNRSQCNAAWARMPLMQQQQPERDRERERRRGLRQLPSRCSCSGAELSWGLRHVGSHYLAYPPGIGTWFSTPKGGECDENAPLGSGANSCSWKRHPGARIIYGFELAAKGFSRPGPDDQASLELQRANARIFDAAFGEAHPMAALDCE